MKIERELREPEYLPVGDEEAVLYTEKGVIRIALDGIEAPQTVGNFVELARSGFYDGTRFHVCDGRVALGGCPVTRDLGPAQVYRAMQGMLRGVHPGTGGPGYRIRSEATNNPHNHHGAGAVSMARTASGPDTAGSQFFVNLIPQPQLDGDYTVFGHVMEGLDVARHLKVGDAILSVGIVGGRMDPAVIVRAEDAPMCFPGHDVETGFNAGYDAEA